MERSAVHSELEKRLTTLETRIAGLKRKVSQAHGTEKAEALRELKGLEQRHKEITGQLRALEREAPHPRPTKAKVEKVAHDLAGAVEDAIAHHDTDRDREIS